MPLSLQPDHVMIMKDMLGHSIKSDAQTVLHIRQPIISVLVMRFYAATQLSERLMS